AHRHFRQREWGPAGAAHVAAHGLPDRRRNRHRPVQLCHLRPRIGRGAQVANEIAARPQPDGRTPLRFRLRGSEEEERHRMGHQLRNRSQPGHAELLGPGAIRRRRRCSTAGGCFRDDRQAHGRAEGDALTALIALAAIARLPRDTRGATAVEFAAIAPCLLMVLLGVMDLSYNLYASTLLEGALQRAARDSTIEGAEGRQLDIDNRVRDVVDDLVVDAEIKFDRRAYTDFSDISRPEEFTDANGDGTCNDGEPFEDANRNGTWDDDRGKVGMGGARDAVLYT